LIRFEPVIGAEADAPDSPENQSFAGGGRWEKFAVVLWKNVKTAVLALLAIITLSGTALAQGSITSCGKITQPGSYSIPPHSTLQSNGGDCLVITAANVTINTQIAGIEGKGTGAGIHILRSANNFNIGIQDDGDHAYIGSDYGAPLWIGDQVNTAILLNHVQGSVINGAGMHAIDNGIWIKGGRNNMVTGYETSLQTGRNNPGPSECCWEVIASDSDAIRIDNGSTGNYIYQADVTKAGSDAAGVHVTGQAGMNFIAESAAGSSGTGIQIESGSLRNFIFNNDTFDNGLDLKDANPNCGTNLWSGNNFTTADPSGCVH
jgi:hypothetical protein